MAVRTQNGHLLSMTEDEDLIRFTIKEVMVGNWRDIRGSSFAFEDRRGPFGVRIYQRYLRIGIYERFTLISHEKNLADFREFTLDKSSIFLKTINKSFLLFGINHMEYRDISEPNFEKKFPFLFFGKFSGSFFVLILED